MALSFQFGTVGSPKGTPKKPGGSVGSIEFSNSIGLETLELGWVRAVRVSEETCAAIKQTGEDQGVSLGTTGQLFLLVGILSIACGILWGNISDRLGRGQAFGLSFLIQGIGFALFWLNPAMAAFIFGSVLIGLTMRAAFTLCAAASGDYV